MIIRVFIFISIVFSSNFEILSNSATFYIEDRVLKQPFLGGVNYPRIQWVDWDEDEYNELFILDEDGCIKLYDYVIPIDQSEAYFEIKDTSFGGLCGMSWFNIVNIDQDVDLEMISQSFNNSNEVQVYDIVEDQFLLKGTLTDSNEAPIISDSSMVPTFSDIDNDGDYDFFTGNIIGTVTFYENIGISDNNLPVFELISFNWQDIWIVGPSRHGASAITFVDIDSDSDLDLCWGDYFQRSLYIIFNIGNSNTPIMDIDNIVSDFPYNEPIYTVGRNMPSFNDIDNDGDQDLFITVLGGDAGIQLVDNFLFYRNTDDIFNLETENFMNTLDFNSDVSPKMIDIDNDNDLDLFIGQDYDTSTFPIRGRIHFFRNIGNSEFQLEDNAFLGTDIGNSLVPEFTDIDNDGDEDLFIGNYNGTILFYKNQGSPSSHNFVFESNLSDIDLDNYSVPNFIDIDNDGDQDLFIGTNSGKIHYYKNIGNQESFQFEFVDDSFFDIDVGYRSSPDFIDIDNDGDYDLVIGSMSENISIFKNSGNIENPTFASLNSCTQAPYYGMNTKPDLYTNNEVIFALIGLSTGGLIHSIYNSSMYGDVNQDSLIDILDILIFIEYIIGNTNEIDYCLADIDMNNMVDLFDIMFLIDQIIS